MRAIEAEPWWFVESLHVKNVRSFGPDCPPVSFLGPDRRISRWTVILGENGVGKSTLLECIKLFAQLEVTDVVTHNGDDDGEPSLTTLWAAKPNDVFLRNLPRTEGNVLGVCEIRLLLRRTDCLDAHEGEAKLALMAVAARDHSRESVRAVFCDRAGATQPQESLGRPVMPFVYGAGRRMAASSLAEEPRGARDDIDDQRPLENPANWLLKLDYSASKARGNDAKRWRAKLAQVMGLLVDLLPGVEEIRITDPRRPSQSPQVEFRTPDGWLPLHQLGFGYKTLIAWVVDFASHLVESYPDSSDPLSKPAVVLVDEIDLHLHPKWQRELMGYLSARFPNTQFIVTAHSPIFVQAAEDANLVVLRRDPEQGHVVIDNHPESIRGWRLDQIMTSDLFGFGSARSPRLEPLLAERTKLLAKARLTAGDKRRLKALEADIGDLPVGRDAREVRLMEEIRDALRSVQEKNGGAG